MLDMRALAFALIPMVLGICLAHVFNWHIHRQFRGPGWWALGSFFLIVGLALLLMRGQIGELGSIAAFAALTAANLLFLHGFTAFAGLPPHRLLPVLALGLNLIGIGLFTLVIPSVAGRWLVQFLSCLGPLLLQLRIQRQIAQAEGWIGAAFIFCVTIGLLCQPLIHALLLFFLAGPGEPSLMSPVIIPLFVGFLTLNIGYASGCILVAANRSRLLLEQTALQDPLTHLPNRRALDAELARCLGDGRRHGGARVALALFDLDHFKRINDQHGHQMGDLFLQHFAGVALAQCRGGDMLARMGGEEFALLMRDTDRAGAHEAAERIRSALEDAPLCSPTAPTAAGAASARGIVIHCTLSAGVAVLATADPRLSFEDLYRRADAALYAAKAAGRNRVEAATDLAAGPGFAGPGFAGAAAAPTSEVAPPPDLGVVPDGA
jgi:diguanylate cyclase (GGDEF)-like protein